MIYTRVTKMKTIILADTTQQKFEQVKKEQQETLYITYLCNALKSAIDDKGVNTFETYNFRAYSDQMRNPCFYLKENCVPNQIKYNSLI